MSNGTALTKYDAACQAIAEAKATDELLEIREDADRLRAAATIARNRALEIDAAEIRIRAERRLGEMMDLQKQAGLLSTGSAGKGRPSLGGSESDPPNIDKPITLAELGIDKHLADRARKLWGLPPDRFERDLAGWRAHQEEVTARVALDIASTGAKRERRAQKEADLAARILKLPDRRWGVIYADPPWRLEPRSRDTGLNKAADNHYPTAATEDIAFMTVDVEGRGQLEVGELAAPNAVLFLWATVPMLRDALIVMDAWGFEYRSHTIWKKVYPGQQKGTGYWFRNEHELLFVGVRGSVPAPAPGLQWGSVINAPVGKHSEKPEQFRDLIEAYYPSLPKLELFRRGAAPKGWDCFGNEVDPHPDPLPQAGEGADAAARVDTASAVQAEDPEIPNFLRRNKAAAHG